MTLEIDTRLSALVIDLCMIIKLTYAEYVSYLFLLSIGMKGMVSENKEQLEITFNTKEK